MVDLVADLDRQVPLFRKMNLFFWYAATVYDSVTELTKP